MSTPPRQFLSRAQVRDLDRRAIQEYGIPALVLMENAGRGAAATLLALGVHGPVVIACGKGNNGGDGLVMARCLADSEVDVQVRLFAAPEELSDEAATNWRIVERMGVRSTVCEPARFSEPDLDQELGRAEWVVDALFGTGLQGPVRPPFDRIIAAINQSRTRIFAVDIPSGLDCDRGEPQGATIRARHTATFVAPKLGYAQPAAAAWIGTLHVVDIGAPARLLEIVS
jgi:NAD(P)H-hydrate epimerase